MPAPPPASDTVAAALGLSGGGNIQYSSESELARTLDGYRDLGARWIRFDVAWSDVQWSGPTSWNWSRYDRVVSGAHQRGIKVQGMLGYSPPWANGGRDNKYPPSRPADYAAFCGAAAARYAPQGVHHWEVWNEPNLHWFWQPAADPAAYSRLLTACSTAVRAVDPAAVIITGGSAPAATNGQDVDPVTWLSALYANGAREHFDAVGHHPYSWPTLPAGVVPGNAWSQLAWTSPSLRSVMQANGDSAKRIWATEMGAPTNIVGETAQASLVTEAWTSWQAQTWAGPLMWYGLRDTGTNPLNRENWFGLLRFDWSAKPAYAVFRNVAING